MTDDLNRAQLIVTSNSCRCGNKWTNSRLIGMNGSWGREETLVPAMIDPQTSSHIFCFRCVSLHLPKNWTEYYHTKHSGIGRRSIPTPTSRPTSSLRELEARILGEKKS